MIEIKEVIETTRILYNSLINDLCNQYRHKEAEHYAKLRDMAISALEKQIGVEHHHTRIDDIQDEIRVSVCPNCLHLIFTYKDEYPSYCNWCSQKIDWKNV